MIAWIRKLFRRKPKPETAPAPLRDGAIPDGIYRANFGRPRGLWMPPPPVMGYQQPRYNTAAPSRADDGFPTGLAMGAVGLALLASHSNSRASENSYASCQRPEPFTSGDGGDFGGGGATESWSAPEPSPAPSYGAPEPSPSYDSGSSYSSDSGSSSLSD